MIDSEEVKVGSFQVVLLFLLGINFVTVSMNHTLPGFHSYTPNFYCKIKGSVNSTNTCITPLEILTTNSTISVFENGQEYSSCETGYRFESVRGETTIVTEWGLICERKYLLPFSNILYFCGVLIGAWIAGVLADRVGRLPVLAISLYTQGTLAVALYVIQDYRAFLVARGLQGIFVQGLQISTYTLLLELFPVRTRTLIGITSQFAWAIGVALLAGLSYAIADWRVLQLATSVPTAITVLYIWIIPESPRWLMAKGKLTEAHMALEKIAKYNNTCCRKNRVEVEINVEEANATIITESITPVKPKRKSKMSGFDINESKTTNDVLPEEAANLLTSLDSSEDKNTDPNCLLSPSESLERKISDLELQLELDKSQNESKNETEASTPPISPCSFKNDTNCRLSENSLGNQEVLPDVIDEIVELRTTQTPKEKQEFVESNATVSGEKKNEDIEKKMETANNQNFLKLIRDKKLRRNFIVMIFVWLSVSLCYSGWMFHLPNITCDRHVNFTINASLDLVAYGMTYMILIRFGRRIPLSIYLILNGTICIVVGAVIMPIHENGIWTRPTKLTLILIGKGIIVSSFAIIYLQTVEIFPTILRGTSLGYCEIFNNIGSLIGPQFLALGEKTLVTVPISIIGILCILSGILSLGFPETLNKPLPDTIEQAKIMFKKYREKLDLEEEDKTVRKNNKRQTTIDEQTERDILREKLFSDNNGEKTWVDAGNGIIVNFSDNSRAKNAE